MAMSIKYEDHDAVGLLATERNREFVAAFRDLGRDLNGQRFTVDIGPVDWQGGQSELTFQVSPLTRVSVLGSSFEPDPKTGLETLFGYDARRPNPGL